jgi:hypothetical protein
MLGLKREKMNSRRSNRLLAKTAQSGFHTSIARFHRLNVQRHGGNPNQVRQWERRDFRIAFQFSARMIAVSAPTATGTHRHQKPMQA